MNIYIEKLTSKTSKVLLQLSNQINIVDCIYIDLDEAALAKQEKLKKLRFKKLEFSFEDIRDEQGVSIGRKIVYGDVLKVQKEILNHPSYKDIFKFETSHLRYFLYFLQKSIDGYSAYSRNQNL